MTAAQTPEAGMVPMARLQRMQAMCASHTGAVLAASNAIGMQRDECIGTDIGYLACHCRTPPLCYGCAC